MAAQTQKPGAYVDEIIIFTPEIHIGYNVAGDIIKIRKLTSNGGKFERDVFDEDVTDRTVDKWIKITRWRQYK